MCGRVNFSKRLGPSLQGFRIESNSRCSWSIVSRLLCFFLWSRRGGRGCWCSGGGRREKWARVQSFVCRHRGASEQVRRRHHRRSCTGITQPRSCMTACHLQLLLHFPLSPQSRRSSPKTLGSSSTPWRPSRKNQTTQTTTTTTTLHKTLLVNNGTYNQLIHKQCTTPVNRASVDVRRR